MSFPYRATQLQPQSTHTQFELASSQIASHDSRATLTKVDSSSRNTLQTSTQVKGYSKNGVKLGRKPEVGKALEYDTDVEK